MGNQQASFNNFNDPISLPTFTSTKLNQRQVTNCQRKLSQIQEKMQKQYSIQQYFDNYAEIQYKKYPNGNIYIGGLDQYDKPSGYGRLIHTDGSIQQGNFKYGRMNGKGISFSSNGSSYQGFFQDGKQKGQGVYKKGDYIYQGSFENGTYNGKGQQKNIQQKYEFSGVFQNGRRKKGKLAWTNNMNVQCQYDGQFNSNNQFDGYGQLKNAKGVYTGQFRNGQKNGLARFKFVHGVLYVGDYKNGVREGYGTLYTNTKDPNKQQEVPQNISYQGYFVQNSPHGIGCIYDSKIKQFKIGIYEKGEPVRQANAAQKKAYTQSTQYQMQNKLIHKHQEQNYYQNHKKSSNSPMRKN